MRNQRHLRVSLLLIGILILISTLFHQLTAQTLTMLDADTEYIIPNLDELDNDILDELGIYEVKYTSQDKHFKLVLDLTANELILNGETVYMLNSKVNIDDMLVILSSMDVDTYATFSIDNITTSVNIPEYTDAVGLSYYTLNSDATGIYWTLKYYESDDS